MTDRRFAAYLVAAVCAVIAWMSVPSTASAIQNVSTSALGGVTHEEFCPSVATTTFAKVIADRKNLTIQNLSSATCYASFEPMWTGTVGLDPTAPTTTGSHGYKFAAGDQGSFDFGAAIPLRVACTAATTTPACLQVMQVR